MRKPSSPAISIRSAVSYRILVNSRLSKPSVYPPRAKRKTVLFKVDAVAADHDLFGAKPHSLFESRLSCEKNPAARTKNAMPWNCLAAGSKSPDDLTRRARVSACRGDIAIRRDLAFGYPAHRRKHLLKHSGRRHAYCRV